MKLLEGKTAIVTGASRGIGKAIALKFAQEGCNIAFTDLFQDENMKATYAELQALGVKATEKYPKEQIAEIEKKIAERMAGQSGQQFENHVKKAATAFDAGNFNVARFWYKKALELKPNDEEVKKRLAEIQEKMK